MSTVEFKARQNPDSPTEIEVVAVNSVEFTKSFASMKMDGAEVKKLLEAYLRGVIEEALEERGAMEKVVENLDGRVRSSVRQYEKKIDSIVEEEAKKLIRNRVSEEVGSMAITISVQVGKAGD